VRVLIERREAQKPFAGSKSKQELHCPQHYLLRGIYSALAKICHSDDGYMHTQQ